MAESFSGIEHDEARVKNQTWHDAALFLNTHDSDEAGLESARRT